MVREQRVDCRQRCAPEEQRQSENASSQSCPGRPTGVFNVLSHYRLDGATHLLILEAYFVSSVGAQKSRPPAEADRLTPGAGSPRVSSHWRTSGTSRMLVMNFVAASCMARCIAALSASNSSANTASSGWSAENLLRPSPRPEPLTLHEATVAPSETCRMNR